MRSLSLLMVALLLATPALAQDSSITQKKDPGRATAYSSFVLGGGHIYTGEYGRVAGMWAFGGGSFAAGYAFSSPDDRNPLYSGAAILAMTWIYNVVDASRSAKRYNKRVTANVYPTDYGLGVTFNVKF